MIGLMSGMLVLAILQNSINERKREFAILRCLGASRSFSPSSNVPIHNYFHVGWIGFINHLFHNKLFVILLYQGRDGCIA